MSPRSCCIAVSWLVLGVSMAEPSVAWSQSEMKRYPVGQAQEWMNDVCDSDWDGAGIGAGLGGAAGYALAALAYDSCSDGLCAVGAVVGAAAGLWAGLALDSRRCASDPPEPSSR